MSGPGTAAPTEDGGRSQVVEQHEPPARTHIQCVSVSSCILINYIMHYNTICSSLNY